MPKGKIKFSNAKELAELTEEYFAECDRVEYAVGEDDELDDEDDDLDYEE